VDLCWIPLLGCGSLSQVKIVEIVPGVPLDGALRGLLSEQGIDVISDDFHVVHRDGRDMSRMDVVEWLVSVPENSRTGLPIYLEAVYRERPDLQKAFPEVAYGELGNFGTWLSYWGRAECSSVRLLGHVLPPTHRRRDGARRSPGVDLVGFLNSEHGVGEAGRLLGNALGSVDVEVAALSYRNSRSRQTVEYPLANVGTNDVVITAVNAELNEPLRESFGHEFFAGRYLIGQWFWELEDAPSWYRPNYKYVNELWAPTRFIEEMLRRDAPKSLPVVHMPLPLRAPEVPPDLDRSTLGLPEGLLFLFSFDFLSVFKRKNPLGVVDAFCRAFAHGEGPTLVLKSINSSDRPADATALRERIADRDDIVWIDEYLDRDQTVALTSLCDCYVSLHRSEGLGLTIAEAMMMGKPVIATAYSGNMDFMSDTNSFPVPWKKVRVGRDAEAYSPRAKWAEPDIAEAARLMRHVWEHPEEARRIGKVARADLSERFTLEATGARMKHRLEEIWEQRSGR